MERPSFDQLADRMSYGKSGISARGGPPDTGTTNRLPLKYGSSCGLASLTKRIWLWSGETLAFVSATRLCVTCIAPVPSASMIQTSQSSWSSRSGDAARRSTIFAPSADTS